jgi:hypothetical protein
MALTAGQTFSGNVIDKSFFFAPGGDLFVVTVDTETASGSGTQIVNARAGVIGDDTINFVNASGGGNYVQTGAVTATATATGDDATATATAQGSIFGDQIIFGNGNGNFVEVAPTATATATGANATATATATAGDISHDMIVFGGGNGDFVEVAAATAAAIATATNTATGAATATATVTGDAAITYDTIRFGSGDGDFVEVAAATTTLTLKTATGTIVLSDETDAAGAIASAPFSGTTSATADANVVVSADISNDTITFGNGKGDFVEEGIPEAGAGAQRQSQTGEVTATAQVTVANINNDTIFFGHGDGDFVSGPDNIKNDSIAFGDGAGDYVSDTVSAFFFQDGGSMSNDRITFGNGAGDYVSTNAATITNNHIQMGNGTGDYVSLLGSSSNNFIGLGNGSGDAVTLGSGAGGDRIVTGTGLDTVTVGDHTKADFFNFALGTNGSSFTTITGAQIGDFLISGNHLGSNVVNSSTSFTTLADFIAGLVLTNGNTYVGTNGTDTFVVTDFNGQVGAVELVGVFSGHAFNHVLTLQGGLHF